MSGCKHLQKLLQRMPCPLLLVQISLIYLDSEQAIRREPQEWLLDRESVLAYLGRMALVDEHLLRSVRFEFDC